MNKASRPRERLFYFMGVVTEWLLFLTATKFRML